MSGREYAKILPSFWTGETGKAIRKLGPWHSIVAVYLMSAPCSKPIGLYHLPLVYLSHETGCPIDVAPGVLRDLAKLDFAHYDEAAEFVWVPSMALIQIGSELRPNDRRVRWVAKMAAAVSARPFFDRFVARYGAAFQLEISNPVRSFDGQPNPHRSQDQDQEQEQDQEQQREQEHSAPPPIPVRSLAPVPRHVESFERSFVGATPATAAVEALVSETRQAAKGAPFHAVGWEDREALQKLAEWSARPDIGPERLRAALVAFWAEKGPTARLSWITESEPGRFLARATRAKAKGVTPAADSREHARDADEAPSLDAQFARFEKPKGVANGR